MSNADEPLTGGEPIEDLEDLFEYAPLGYLSMRSNGPIVRVNATLADWTGYAKTDLVGKRFQELLTVGTRIFYETNVLPLLNVHGKFSEISLELQTIKAGKLPVFAHALLRPAVDGQQPLVRLALSKAHERWRYERELVDARAAAESSYATTQVLLDRERETAHLREQFIAVLGHDLRNPLASIANGVQLLKRELPVSRRERVLGMVEGSALRMGGLIDDILDLARGRLGAGIPLDLRPNVVLAPIIEQVVSELRLGSLDRVIETDINVPTPITCDPTRIGQLVSNLLGNAITHGATEESVRVNAHSNEDGLTVWVANGGAPIPPEAMSRLFQPFFRGEVRSSRQGLGLGLYIASEIAKEHGGTLIVASTSLETRFTFSMPVAR